jgi:hypothetical protein
MQNLRMGSDDFHINFNFDRIPNTSWQGRTIYCLLGLLATQRLHIEGLALLPTGSKGEYYRVGRWTAWYDHGLPQKDKLGYDAVIKKCEVSEMVYNLDEHENIDVLIWQEIPGLAEDERRYGDKESTKNQRKIGADHRKKILEDKQKDMVTPQDEQKVSRESGGYRMYLIAIV